MTVPHYGKREPGLLTAASPGDTLYFPFASYNDSGDSEILTGLAVTDIEVIKNGLATVRATDSGYSLISDTGMVGDRAGLYRCSIQLFNTADDASFYASGSWYNAFIDAVTIDGRTVRFHLGSWEIGRQRVDVRELIGDTGAANWLQQTYAAGFADTGVNQRLGQIQSDVDTGLRVHIDDLDTGLHDVIADLDTGIRDYIDNTDTGLRRFLDNMDTGIKNRFDDLAEDTGGVNINAIQGDTGAAGWLRAAFAGGFADTGLNERLARIQSDVDTGLRVHIDDSDTGLKDVIADLDTGLRDYIDNTDTGLRAILQTTGVNVTKIVGDTGAANWLQQQFAAGFADTGVNERLTAIEAQTTKLTFDTGNELYADIRKVNGVTVQGTGANADEWRPGS
jgi:hypothetical protein